MEHSKEEMQEKLRILEAYMQNKVAAASPEAHLRGGQKALLSMELERLFSDLEEHLNEDGRALLEEYGKKHTELLEFEKADSFIEGRIVAAMMLGLQSKTKKRPRE